MVLYKNFFQRVILHVLFWAGFVLLFSFIFSYQSRFPFSFFLEHYLVNLIPFVLFTYLTIYVLVPSMLYKKRIVLFILTAVLTSVAFAIFKLFTSKFIFYRFFVPDIFSPNEWISAKLVFQNILWIWMPTMIFAAIKYFAEWFRTRNEKTEMEKKNLQAELKLLKAQLQPHFLFNTLNNLYVLALEKSDKTPDVVLKISELFHYVLYECDAREVSLEKEMQLINNYIELEKLRYDSNLKINIKKHGELSSALIAPMMLFVLVENAFKHGVRNDTGNPVVNINIEVRNQEMVFSVKNTIPKDFVAGNIKKEDGVGLKNLKRRLDLLYHDNYSLITNRLKNEFVAKLVIAKE